jgi:hypothetical protein
MDTIKKGLQQYSKAFSASLGSVQSRRQRSHVLYLVERDEARRTRSLLSGNQAEMRA